MKSKLLTSDEYSVVVENFQKMKQRAEAAEARAAELHGALIDEILRAEQAEQACDELSSQLEQAQKALTSIVAARGE